jgi:hypothetical protein
MTGTGNFSQSFAGLVPGTTYYFRSYAVNSYGTSMSTIMVTATISLTVPDAPTGVSAVAGDAQAVVSFTGTQSWNNGGIGTLYYTAFSSPGNIAGYGTSSPITVTGLTNGTPYTFTVTATNIVGTSSASATSTVVTYTDIPLVLVLSPTNIGQTAATFNGSIASIGLSNVTTEGFEWGLSTTYGTIDSNTGSFGVNSYTDSPSSLTCGTAYHYRFFATNSQGTASSTDQSFTTSACPSGGGGGGVVYSSGGGGSISSGGGSSSVSLSSTSATSTCTTTPVTVPPLPAIALTLTQGSTGTAVKNLQTYLVVMKYLAPQYITGYYGALTKAAVITYITNSTSVIICPSTATSTLTAPVVMTAPASSSIEPLISTSLLNLTYGSTGPSVISLQDSLITYGYLAPSYNTGYYGNLTKVAVAKYLSATSRTLTSSVIASPITTSIPLFTRTLTLGSTGSDVKNLQIFLNDHGFTISTSGNGSPNHESTYFGPATKAAVIKFQDAYAKEILTPYGLTKGTGIFGTETREEVNMLL